MDKNFCSLLCVVEDVGESIDSYISRPIITVSLYNRETGEYDTTLKVVIMNEADIKFSQNILVGDILLVQGILSYDDDYGYVIHSDSILFLSKNKTGAEIEYRKMAALDAGNIRPFVSIKGIKCTEPLPGKIFAMIKRDAIIRGDISEHEIVPLQVQPGSKLKEGDHFYFQGTFKNNELVGDVDKISEN